MFNVTRGIVCRVLPTIGILVAFGFSPAATLKSQAGKNVLALYWYAREYPTNVLYERGLLRTLRNNPQEGPEYYSEYLEADRFPGEDQAAILRDYLREKYAHHKIDVIVATAETPFAFLLANRALFPDVPIICTVFGPPDAAPERSAPGVAGLFITGTYAKTVESIRSIHPETERVLVITSLPNNGGKARENVIRKELAPFERHVSVEYLTDLSTDALLSRITNAPARTVVLYVRHAQESETNALDPVEAVNLFARTANVPIYSIAEPYFGHGVVGGYLVDHERIGAQAGTLALSILAGARPEDLPATSAELSATFDWRALRRWNIDTARLPPGSDIRFRTLTIWDHYRGYVVGGLAVFALQALLIVSLVIQRARRRETEARNTAIQDRYARATAAGGVGVWDWNLETNEIYLDPSLKAVLGYEDDEIRNHLDDWSRLVHPDDVAAVRECAREHLAGKTPSYEVEHRMRHRNGSVRWFLTRGSAVWQDGRAVRVMGTGTDITGRKASEQALHIAQADLARLSRLTALGEFAASLAHEMRQPLTAIMMNAKACLLGLGSAGPDLSEIRVALVDVVDASQRADDLIRRNRELFKEHKVQMVPLDISAVVREVLVLARARIQSSHVTPVTTLPDLPAVSGDRVQLQQVLLNLIANSIDAMEGVEHEERVLEIAASLEPERVVKVTVTDSGVGLDDVDCERMFTLSYTTKPTGTGVGLSISRSIIEAHGGQLWAARNAGRGATFAFTVPAPPAS